MLLESVTIPLKEHLRHLMENLKGFRYPTAAKCAEITIFDQQQPFET